MKKISKAQIATTYANALYMAAIEKNSLPQVFADVQKLVTVLDAEKEFVSYMCNPLWKAQDKLDVLKKIAAKIKISAETLRCLDVVLENGRFAEIAQILAAFIHSYYQKNNIAEVSVDSAKALSVAQDKKLKANLEKVLGKKVVLTYTVLPEVLGGLRIKFGSEMFDDTIAAKLNRLEIMMKGE